MNIPVVAAIIGTVPNLRTPPEGHAKKMSEVLGEIVWLMSQSGSFYCAIASLLSTVHKQMFIQDLEWPVAEATKGKC